MALETASMAPSKRILIGDQATNGGPAAMIPPHLGPAPSTSRKVVTTALASPNEYARLVTRSAQGGQQVLSIHLDRSFYVGRSAECDYVIAHPAASSKHCRLYALQVDTGEKLVCLEDTSTNGTLFNQRRVSRATVILSDGDVIEIAGCVFRYQHGGASAAPLSPSQARQQAGCGAAAFYVGDFLVLSKTLGSGAFSRVHLAISTKSHTQYACKRMIRRRLPGDQLSVVKREVEMLKSAAHPNVNRVEAVEVDEKHVHIFLELVPGGDLFSYLIRHGRLDAPEVKWILYQMLHGLRHLHDDVNIAHRDIKLENVVLACAGPFPKIQLTDFGQARLADEDFRSLQGTLQYMAPEQLLATSRSAGYGGKPADVWSTGIVFAYLLTGGHPFEPWDCSNSRGQPVPDDVLLMLGQTACAEIEHSPQDGPICRAVVQGTLSLPNLRFGKEDSQVRELMSQMLTHDPAERSTAAIALRSTWMTSSANELLELYNRIVI
ncbi:hypothetical protein JCM10908_002287 [Rhodotorula pacifica]|uniref:FHA domain-containing serine/threonine-protein kinase n=1 Tax=Rhodotorula pacifica TaxID=1495444 RepID=UPI00317045A3